jgi:cell fate (sporulation/competence/biofilm development) regulator YlbF (YheA/YmcA/DUF963 family)
MIFTIPLCDACGERAEMMMSVSDLIGERLALQSVLDELCSICANMIEQIVQVD